MQVEAARAVESPEAFEDRGMANQPQPNSIPKVSVVMPIYNEMATIEEILLRVQAVAIDKELILVDDMSTDGTRDLLVQMAAAASDGSGRFTLPESGVELDVSRMRVEMQDRNYGKGAALRRGFELARGEIVLIQDADLEYDPEDWHTLIEPIDKGRADIVYGSRFTGAGAHRVLYFWHSIGNRFLTLLSNMLTDLNLSDVWTCYKVFRRELLKDLHFTEDRFGFEVEITAQVAKKGFRIYEIPVDYHGRTYAEGKKITWRDGCKALWQTLKHNVLR